ncbi:hypothetical protein HDU98_008917 [Podochytrium sp. JEL0797]|nr:hypothetical protein HDU98_008917 [Podochytrium sp. JEL0797]
MKTCTAPAVFLLLASIAAAALSPADIKDVISFGDSLSDTGNLFALTGDPPAPYYQGRFSNGPVWVEDLTKFIPNAKLHDFAYAGAVATIADALPVPIYSNTNVTLTDLPDLMAQIGMYQKDAAVNKLDFKSTLFTVWAGGNDFDYAAAANTTVNPIDVAAAAIAAAEKLITLGAVNVMVNTLPSLDLTPSGRAVPAEGPLLKLASSLFDSVIVSGVAQLSAKYPQANVILTDAGLFFNHAVLPSFGLTNVIDKCFNGTTVCATPDTYLFWDGVHPTTFAHNHLGQYAYNQLFNISGWLAPASVVNPVSPSTILVSSGKGVVAGSVVLAFAALLFL